MQNQSTSGLVYPAASHEEAQKDHNDKNNESDGTKGHRPMRRNRVHFAYQCRTFQQDTGNDLSSRLARLENLIESGLDDFSRRIDALSHQLEKHDKASSKTEKHARASSGLKAYHETSEDESDEFPRGDSQFHQEPFPAMVEAAGQFTSKGEIASGPSVCPVDPRDNLDMEALSPAMQESLTMTLYPKNVTRRLVDVYLETINIYRHPIPKNVIYEAFDTFYEDGGVVDAEHITRFGFIAALTSIGALYVVVSMPELIPELSTNGAYDEVQVSKRLCNAAQIACFTAQNMGREDLFTVLTFTHLSRLFFVRGCIGLSWSSTVNFVRVALSMGLHRDGEAMGLDRETVERRRMVWSLVYSMERTNSLGYGRPMLISDAFCDTRPPQLDGDKSEIPAALLPMFQDTPPPNLLLINILRSKLASFIGDLAFEVQNVHKKTAYSRILEIHSSFNTFVLGELPFYFQIRLRDDKLVQNTQCDAYFSFVKIQRYQLWFDFNSFMLTLHCPFLLRYSSRTKERYATSYDACLEAVKLNLALRQELLYDESLPLRYRDSMAGFRWFNTIVVAGFILLKNPSSNDATLLIQHMNKFLEWRGRHNGSPPKSDLNKEIEITRAFLEQAMMTLEERHQGVPLTPSNASSDETTRKRQRRGSTESREAFSPSKAELGSPSGSNTDQQLSNILTGNINQALGGGLPWTTNTPERAATTGDTNPSMLNTMGVNSTSDIQYTLSKPSEDGSEDINESSFLFDMPMITSNMALNPQTLMPVWPWNVAEASPSAQLQPLGRSQDTQDTQWRLDLW